MAVASQLLSRVEGLLNTVNWRPPREAGFWFLHSGIMPLIVRAPVSQAAHLRLAIPRSVAWICAALTVIGVVVVPISGICLSIPPVAGMVIRSRRSIEERGERWLINSIS